MCARQIERVAGADRADLQRLDRVREVLAVGSPGWRSASTASTGPSTGMPSMTSCSSEREAGVVGEVRDVLGACR